MDKLTPNYDPQISKAADQRMQELQVFFANMYFTQKSALDQIKQQQQVYRTYAGIGKKSIENSTKKPNDRDESLNLTNKSGNISISSQSNKNKDNSLNLNLSPNSNKIEDRPLKKEYAKSEDQETIEKLNKLLQVNQYNPINYSVKSSVFFHFVIFLGYIN